MNTGFGQNGTTAAGHDDNRNPVPFKTASEQAGRQAWMVSFADLMAILLTFMVIAFSTKEMKTTSWRDMSQSMQGVFRTEVRSAAATRRSAIGDDDVARLVEEIFPDLAAIGSVKLTRHGVEVDLDAVAVDDEGLADLADLLSSLDRSLLVSVTAPLPSGNPTSIQRILAWERGLTDAFVLRSQLADKNLSREPRISVSVAAKEKAGATLVIEKRGGVKL